MTCIEYMKATKSVDQLYIPRASEDFTPIRVSVVLNLCAFNTFSCRSWETVCYEVTTEAIRSRYISIPRSRLLATQYAHVLIVVISLS